MAKKSKQKKITIDRWMIESPGDGGCGGFLVEDVFCTRAAAREERYTETDGTMRERVRRVRITTID